jgi:alpha-beta hydrolase superfamily lysophospholipase
MSNSLEKIDRYTEKFRIETVRDLNDTVNIRYGVCGNEKADRYLFFLNGRTEWVEKYSYIPFDLNIPSNTTFVAVDHRGQGGSGGARAYVETYDDYATDLQAVVEKVANGKPYSVVAHSMGCLIGLYATLKGKINPDCLVLSSPLFGLPDEPVPTPIAKPLSKLLTMFGFANVSSGGGNFSRSKFECNKLTHDIDMFKRMQESPFKVPGATFGWVAATFAAIDAIFDEEKLKTFRTPTLVLCGSEEQVVDPEAIRRWVRINSERSGLDVRYQMIAGGRHELLSEIPAIYSQAIASIKAFLAQNFLK